MRRTAQPDFRQRDFVYRARSSRRRVRIRWYTRTCKALVMQFGDCTTAFLCCDFRLLRCACTSQGSPVKHGCAAPTLRHRLGATTKRSRPSCGNAIQQSHGPRATQVGSSPARGEIIRNEAAFDPNVNYCCVAHDTFYHSTASVAAQHCIAYCYTEQHIMNCHIVAPAIRIRSIFAIGIAARRVAHSHFSRHSSSIAWHLTNTIL